MWAWFLYSDESFSLWQELPPQSPFSPASSEEAQLDQGWDYTEPGHGDCQAIPAGRGGQGRSSTQRWKRTLLDGVSRKAPLKTSLRQLAGLSVWDGAQWAGVAVAMLNPGGHWGDQLILVSLGFSWLENKKSHILGTPWVPGKLTQLVPLAGDLRRGVIAGGLAEPSKGLGSCRYCGVFQPVCTSYLWTSHHDGEKQVQVKPGI